MPDSSDTETASALAYFQAIEEMFLRLRGRGTLLSPADWEVAERWFTEGVPLDLVHRCLEESFAGFHERGVRRRAGARRRIESLRYCAPAVEAAWEEIREMSAAGLGEAAPPLDIPARLAALAEALPEEVAGRARWQERIRGLIGDPPSVEQALSQLDQEILAAQDAALPEARRREVAHEVEKTLAQLAARLPAAELERARESLTLQALRRRLGLPLLSLFSEEAEGGRRGVRV